MECSEELGDMVKAADPTLALSGEHWIITFFKVILKKYSFFNLFKVFKETIVGSKFFQVLFIVILVNDFINYLLSRKVEKLIGIKFGH